MIICFVPKVINKILCTWTDFQDSEIKIYKNQLPFIPADLEKIMQLSSMEVGIVVNSFIHPSELIILYLMPGKNFFFFFGFLHPAFESCLNQQQDYPCYSSLNTSFPSTLSVNTLSFYKWQHPLSIFVYPMYFWLHLWYCTSIAHCSHSTSPVMLLSIFMES